MIDFAILFLYFDSGDGYMGFIIKAVSFILSLIISIVSFFSPPAGEKIK